MTTRIVSGQDETNKSLGHNSDSSSSSTRLEKLKLLRQETTSNTKDKIRRALVGLDVLPSLLELKDRRHIVQKQLEKQGAPPGRISNLQKQIEEVSRTQFSVRQKEERTKRGQDDGAFLKTI